MSYILDALKKSEQERGHGNIPDVQTVHSSSLNYRNEKKAYWPYFLIVAVSLNLLAIVYFIFDKDSKNTSEISAQQMSPAVTAVTTPHPKPIESAPIVDSLTAVSITEKIEPKASIAENDVPVTAAEADTKPQEPFVTASEPVKTYSSAIDKTNIIDFHELPAQIKQELPAIIISAHVYSNNPAQRSIVINNNFMEEGGYVLDGLILYEITSDGAIFNYQGTLFNFNVVSGWQ